MLREEWQVSAEVWSVTSFSELAREAREVERWNRLHPTGQARVSFVARNLEGQVPVVAASDYVCAYPSLVAGFLAVPFVALGTDGFGRSDTRSALRRFFEVDRQCIVTAALRSLVASQRVSAETVEAAIKRYQIDAEVQAPWLR